MAAPYFLFCVKEKVSKRKRFWHNQFEALGIYNYN